MDSIDLRRYLEDMRMKRDLLQSRLNSIQAELLETEKKLQAAELIQEDYCRQYDMPAPQIAVDPKLQKKFSGLSIKEVLILIAADARGQLDLADAKKVLLKAGVFQNERSAVTSMSPVLSRNEDLFKRTARGTYQLDYKRLNDKERMLVNFGNQTELQNVLKNGDNDKSYPPFSVIPQVTRLASDKDLVGMAIKMLKDYDSAQLAAEKDALRRSFSQMDSDVQLRAKSDFQMIYGHLPRI